MKINIENSIIIIAFIFSMATCSGDIKEGQHHDENREAHEQHGENEGQHGQEVHLSQQQFEALDLKVDTLPMRNLSSTVQVTGRLEVPPQNEAAVTSMIGANVASIQVIEGDQVDKGQVLAWLRHPDLIEMQTKYINNWHQLQYLEHEYARQKKLYEEEVGSGKDYQKTRADYHSTKGNVEGLASQLKLLGLNLERIRKGNIYESVPVVSPISGNIKKVHVKLGRYVQPQYEMFEIVSTEHIHADLMVFEKDIYKVREGQQVRFSVETLPGEELTANIYAVGKSFEQEPKAVHIHAEIENKRGLLLPGMYIKGQVLVNDVKTYAMPEDALVREGEKHFIFTGKKGKNQGGETEWSFQPVEVIPGTSENGWTEIKLLNTPKPATRFVMNNAYYILAEMKKGEGGGHHH